MAYLQDKREGGDSTLVTMAGRFGIGRGALWRAIKSLRSAEPAMTDD